MTGDIDRLLAIEPRIASVDRQPTTVIRRDRPRARRPPRRGAGQALAEQRRQRAIPTSSSPRSTPDGLARSPPRRKCSPTSSSLDAAEDQDDPEAMFQEGWLSAMSGIRPARPRLLAAGSRTKITVLGDARPVAAV